MKRRLLPTSRRLAALAMHTPAPCPIPRQKFSSTQLPPSFPPHRLHLVQPEPLPPLAPTHPPPLLPPLPHSTAPCFARWNSPHQTPANVTHVGFRWAPLLLPPFVAFRLFPKWKSARSCKTPARLGAGTSGTTRCPFSAAQ